MAAVRGGHVWFQSVWPLREMSVWFHCVSFQHNLHNGDVVTTSGDVGIALRDAAIVLKMLPPLREIVSFREVLPL